MIKKIEVVSGNCGYYEIIDTKDRYLDDDTPEDYFKDGEWDSNPPTDTFAYGFIECLAQSDNCPYGFFENGIDKVIISTINENGRTK